ncbi:hypothetical protein S101258_00979 [Lactiplantibacillus plantarum subsp. plantarum]|uniref:Uncharacterized protein n=1 Tax=Lactiplantibacillus plantarum subsp. plantarum TaxID=337330 RepID=A0A2S3U878_LACPN|nr:hypothetical protein S101258_00979 [Lactiplantibacillus plantarum subsp. plantarum]
MVYLIGEPIASFMTWLTAMLNGMSGVAKAPF